MGAHGVGLFDDDDGADFAAEVLKSRSIDVVINALKAIPTEEWEYIENPECLRALLAAELIAHQLGNESGDLPDDLLMWIRDYGGDVDDDNVRLARSAVRRILRSSETLELWRDSDHFDEWLKTNRNLLDRLNA